MPHFFILVYIMYHDLKMKELLKMPKVETQTSVNIHVLLVMLIFFIFSVFFLNPISMYTDKQIWLYRNQHIDHG